MRQGSGPYNSKEASWCPKNSGGILAWRMALSNYITHPKTRSFFSESWAEKLQIHKTSVATSHIDSSYRSYRCKAGPLRMPLITTTKRPDKINTGHLDSIFQNMTVPAPVIFKCLQDLVPCAFWTSTIAARKLSLDVSTHEVRTTWPFWKWGLVWLTPSEDKTSQIWTPGGSNLQVWQSPAPTTHFFAQALHPSYYSPYPPRFTKII